MLNPKIINKILKDSEPTKQVNAEGSVFLRNLVSGKKIFVEIFSPKYIVDYASKLERFLNNRGAKILKVDRGNLTIKTSVGTIYFCVGSPKYLNSNLHRDNFLRGRHDFIEVYGWEEFTNPTP